MKSHATYAGDPRHHATDLAELRAENERLKALLALLDPVENFTMLSTLGDAVEALHKAMRRMSDTHRLIIQALASEATK